jgi:pyruvate carboxylase
MRVRGVKTNIPFLVNVLNHDIFKNGQCYTTFIEETPELFDIEKSQDRATKIIEFIGSKIVNLPSGENLLMTSLHHQNSTAMDLYMVPEMSF